MYDCGTLRVEYRMALVRVEFVELVRNLMAHAQKPHFVFRLNGLVHWNRRGSQFSRLLAAELCASALVMLDTLRSEIVWEYWLPIPFASFPFTSPPVRHRVPPHSEPSILGVAVEAVRLPGFLRPQRELRKLPNSFYVRSSHEMRETNT